MNRLVQEMVEFEGDFTNELKYIECVMEDKLNRQIPIGCISSKSSINNVNLNLEMSVNVSLFPIYMQAVF